MPEMPILCGFSGDIYGIISRVFQRRRSEVIPAMKITTEYIRLEQFLKLQGLADTGGQAKLMIKEGEVLVNGETELRRGRKLRPGDIVRVDEKDYSVE
jgi:ribosome-associated protein